MDEFKCIDCEELWENCQCDYDIEWDTLECGCCKCCGCICYYEEEEL